MIRASPQAAKNETLTEANEEQKTGGKEGELLTTDYSAGADKSNFAEDECRAKERCPDDEMKRINIAKPAKATLSTPILFYFFEGRASA